MPLNYYMCTNCGSWQHYFATAPSCPDCADVRNALPAHGWKFASAAQMQERELAGEIKCERREIDR